MQTWKRTFAVSAALGCGLALAGCETMVSIYTLRIPLAEPVANAPIDAPAVDHVAIEDRRPEKERVVHTGGGLFRCERWYGDETYVPGRVAYLQQLIAARAPPASPVHLRLDRLDTIEYCEETARQGAAAAATGASYGSGSGTVYVASRQPQGDRFELHVSGEVNGRPFTVHEEFLYRVPMKYGLVMLPGTSEAYRADLRAAFAKAADQILAHAAGMPAAAP